MTYGLEVLRGSVEIVWACRGSLSLAFAPRMRCDILPKTGEGFVLFGMAPKNWYDDTEIGFGGV